MASNNANGSSHTDMPPPIGIKASSPEVKKELKNGTPVKSSEDHDRSKDEKNSTGKKSAKRRKVNHACVYCRRSHMTCDLERPCARCVKRDIGHLCHDEPREPAKRTKSEPELAPADSKPEPNAFTNFTQNDGGLSMVPGGVMAANMGQTTLPQPKPLSPTAMQRPQANQNQNFMGGVNQWDFGAQNQFSDMHNLHPYNTFGTTEVNNEYNLLGDFLSSSLLDDGMYNPDDAQTLFNDPLLTANAMRDFAALGTQNQNQPQSSTQAQAGNEISRPSSTFPIDPKAREKFFLTAADPAGNDSPEERMNRLLKAKYDAGMLKPFNYVKGYARLNGYMEKNMRPLSRQKILRQLNQFRPKFREAMHKLTDIQLVKVEMWFERCLMEYDRVFASMAIPACCWRRTGEIYRGNKEMAELIHIPMENLRDGKIALHEIMVEDSLVSYWEKFGAIAFDQSQKAILTTCSLKNPDPTSQDPFLRCCFSFTIRRDMHNIPAMIVGNFLPIQPESRDTVT
ncbi:fungal Zn(2)-Cys(6) binuclear cluster domain-containing protein 5 [Elsinoe australis]|uniref:Fungal Zn(2)-Cys(6) binuclear cluster domain-containing protein 5 n=1 Tax=Elsinoe australis TaxID=40998 RepID=A0A4U7B8I8_9PEZI|nr:fungal Zn(2)-Cys(6) binuclear cluster domain-containing protein 5 [Elsinoe australis]